MKKKNLDHDGERWTDGDAVQRNATRYAASSVPSKNVNDGMRDSNSGGLEVAIQDFAVPDFEGPDFVVPDFAGLLDIGEAACLRLGVALILDLERAIASPLLDSLFTTRLVIPASTDLQSNR